MKPDPLLMIKMLHWLCLEAKQEEKILFLHQDGSLKYKKIIDFPAELKIKPHHKSKDQTVRHYTKKMSAYHGMVVYFYSEKP
tara:strand:- start:4379 stop:4624 length:246 start_codon:yes stop_codon:yes gene_type:complete